MTDRSEEGRVALRTALAVTPGVLLAGLAGGIAFPILPIVGERAGLPLWFIGLILAANRLMRIVSAPLVGWLSDRFGGRRTILVGLVSQIAVMLLYHFGVVLHRPGSFFLVGRILHGPGSACVFVAGQALALAAGGEHHRGRTGSAVRAALALGVPLGLVAGGLLADRIGESATFEVAAGVLVLAAAAGWATIPDLRVGRRRAVPLVEALRSLVRDRRLAIIGALNFAASFCAQGMVLTTAVLLVHERHLSLFGRGDQGTAGIALGVMVVVDAAVMLAAGRVGDRRRAHASIAAVGLTLLVPALATLAWSHHAAGLVGGLVLVGIGTGALGPSLLALVGEVAAPESQGLGVGALQVCGDAGGALGPLVGTALFTTNVAVPYLVSAAVAAAFIPLTVSLVRAVDAGRRAA